jgi:hypothetical protein
VRQVRWQPRLLFLRNNPQRQLHQVLFLRNKPNQPEAKMPFKSEAQRKFLWATEPKLAKKWAKETPKGKKLPPKVKPKRK